MLDSLKELPDIDFDWPDEHRPWPIPQSPWVMYQEWHDLLFAHWPIPFEILRPLVPGGLLLDTFDGTAWLSITPFEIRNLRARFTPPIPGIANFPELNVRTYVTLDDKPGVFFFSLNVTNPLAVDAARLAYHLPYYGAQMSIERRNGATDYVCSRPRQDIPGGEFEASYAPAGEVSTAQPDTLERFLTERYCLYARDTAGTLYRAEIHHAPWPLQPAAADIRRNTMAMSHGIPLPDSTPLFHYSAVLRTVIWLPERLGP